MTSQKIKTSTKTDKELQSIVRAVETDSWTDPIVKQYATVKNELAVYNGMIQLREKAVELTHVGHQGIVKTKQLIRENLKAWFLHTDKMVKDKVDMCLPCQAAIRPSN